MMRRGILILTFLLSALVGRGAALQYWALSTHSCAVTDWDGEKLDFSSHGDSTGGYYHVFNVDYGVTDMSINGSDSISAGELEGLSFKGWYTKKDGWTGAASVGEVDTCLETSSRITGAKIATAGSWNGRPLIVAKYAAERTVDVGLSTFGRGTVSVSPRKDVYEKGDSLELTVQPDAGYGFVRWSDGHADNPRTLTVNENADLRAVVEPLSFGVTFSGGAGAQVDMTAKRVSYDCTYGELATCARTGYAFSGWYTAASGGTKVERDTVVRITADQTLFARWTANTYKVTFDAAGGTASTSSRDVTYDQPYGTLPSCTRTGYAFAGWWTAEKGGAEVKGDSTVSVASAQTLFARWTPNEYALTIHPNGGLYDGLNIEQTLSEKLCYDAKVNSAIGVATRENYTLSGYWTSSSGGVKVYDGSGRNVKCDYWSADYPNGVFRGTAALKVHAIWTPNASVVTLDKQGGAGGSDSVTVRYDTTVPEIASLPTRAGYAFEGYYAAKNGAGRKYYDANGTGLVKWTDAGTTTLYANWTPNGYEVQYDLAGGSTGSDAPLSARVGTAFRVSAPSKTGYTFAGWNVTGTAVDYTAAKWGIGSDAASTAIQDASAVCFDSRYSYVYFLDLALTLDATVTLKANWTANSYRVTFDGNGGGSPEPSSKNVTYGGTYDELARCTRGGCTFAGWYTDKIGGVRIEPGTNVTITAPQTLYAHWTANSYTVTVSPGEGVGGSCPPYTFSDSEEQELTIVLPTRDDHTIASWAVGGASGGTPTVSGTTLKIPGGTYGNLTLTPNWAVVTTATVTFADPEGGNDSIQAVREKGKPIGTAPDGTKSWRRDGYWRDKDSDWDPPLATTVTGDMTVKAKWTSVADVLDCPDLKCRAEGQWVVRTGTPPAPKQGNSWMQLDSSSGEDRIEITITEPGRLIFYYKGANLKAKGLGDPDLVLPSATEWTCATGMVKAASSESPTVVQFTCPVMGFKATSLDSVSWLPEREVIDPIARALDCEGSGLTFAVSGGWNVFTNQAFAKEGISCLSNSTNEAKLTMTVSQSGKLTFWWKAEGGSNGGANLYVMKDGNDIFDSPLHVGSREVKDWTCETVEIDVPTGSAEIVFESFDPGVYTALDHFTWTPDGE